MAYTIAGGVYFDTYGGGHDIYGSLEADSITRSNNVVTMNGFRARIYATDPAGSFYDGNRYYAEGSIPAGSGRGYDEVKGLTGTANLDGGNWYTAQKWFTINVGTYDTSISSQVRWTGGGVDITRDPGAVAIPALTGPSGQTVSASNIKTTTATLSASLTNWGNYCTAGSGQRIEYKLSTDSTWTNLAYSTNGSHTRDLTGLKPGKTYDVRTFTSNGVGLTGNSATIQFKTKNVSGLAALLSGAI